MFRRSSYAQVASGNPGTTQSNPVPSRSAHFSHLSNSIANSTNSPSTPHSHSRHARSLDADGHHSAMPNSLSRSGPTPSYLGPGGYGASNDAATAPPFFVPSYLRGSRHAEKLEEAHKAKTAYREHRSAQSSNSALLSTSSSGVNLHKMTPSHRGLSHDIIERAPPLSEDTVAPWPTRWNDSDKFPQMELDESGRQAKFAGASKSGNDEAAAVRADHPMPRQCGIYYYEVTVVSKGKDGSSRIIGVGFSGSKVPLNRIPGWEPDSFAYHGDDGLCFTNTTSGKNFGPKFGTLDVIGCGINFHTNTAFFTKNGTWIGEPFRDLKPNMLYYPSIGMKKPNETLRANFGQEPFAFDIDSLVLAEKAKIQQELKWAKNSRKEQDSASETAFIHSLIGQYLAHDGYLETARAFAEEVLEEVTTLAPDGKADLPYLDTEEDVDAINRQRIRTAILDGDIDKALKHTNAYYPSVLRDNENIYFKLRCRKFIEMIRACSELHAQCLPIPTPPSKRSTTSTLNNANHNRNSTATDDYDFEMELDEQLGVHNGAPWDRQSADEDDEDDDLEARSKKLADLTQTMLQYGMELKQEFANDPRREVKRALEDTFALVAYENVRESSLAPLLETSGRAPVAEELNSAILVSLGKSSSAALERLVQQTEALVAELGDDGGPGAFINVRRDFLQ